MPFSKSIGIFVVVMATQIFMRSGIAESLVMDISNLNKLIDFFEMVGVIKIKKSMVDGRALKTPFVEYGQIEFDLKVA